jgi:hypothetical protein
MSPTEITQTFAHMRAHIWRALPAEASEEHKAILSSGLRLLEGLFVNVATIARQKGDAA